MHKITTLSGREIIATFDHRFWTNEGFVRVENFKDTTKLAINLINKKNYESEKNKILEKKQFIKIANKYYTEKYIKQLTEDVDEWFREIETNKIAILAGIIGFTLSDGSLNFSKKSKLRVGFSNTSRESAEELHNDLELLKFGRKTIRKVTKTSTFGKDTDDEHIVTQTEYKSEYFGCLPILLESLGVTVGRRTEQISSIPEFILKGTKEIKRSFLSGLFGGDGSKIRYNIHRSNGSSQVTLNTISLSKIPKYVESLKLFMKNIGTMLEIFDIKTNYIHTFKGKYGKLVVHLGFEQKTENIIKFYEEIGYKYDILKNQESGICVEYLKYKTMMQNKFINSILEIRKDIDNKLSYTDLMKTYNRTYSQIAHIKEKYKNGTQISTRRNFKDFMNIEDFISKCTVDNNTLFIPIAIVNDYTETNIIADITVESENHTFIADNFLIHNSPRVCYQSSMGKQAMGIYTSNFQDRMDTLAHVLSYSQKPLCATRGMDFMNYRELPAGVNAIVAIAPWGYNQEDSLIMNKSSVDKGLFRSTFYRCYTDTEREAETGNNESFEKPVGDNIKRMKTGNYNKIDVDGFVEPGIKVNEDDAIIGKTTPSGETRLDNSTKMRANENGVVDKVMLSSDSEGRTFTKVRVRSERIPEVGDKFCMTEDHDVLTTVGWIPIKEVTLEHEVATLKDGKILEYRKPSKLINYEYEGKMYDVESNHVSLTVTPNHRMWVSTRVGSYKFEKADEIFNKRRKYQKNVENIELKQKPKEFFKNKFRIFDGEQIIFEFPLKDWLTMFGIWIAEGGVYYKEDKGVYYVDFATNKKRVREELDRIEKNIELNFYKGIRKPERETENTSYRFCNKKIAKYFNSLNITGSLNKNLPDWVWFLTKEDCRILIHGMCLGDGHTMKNGTRRYDTSSDKLANSFQRLVLHAGWSSNKCLKYPAGHQSYIKSRHETITSNADAWRLTINTKQNNPLVNKTSKLDKWVDFNGKVYCLTVSSGIFYVRKNGKPVWTGNSSRHKRLCLTVSC
jgi:intein/homing endonuclease